MHHAIITGKSYPEAGKAVPGGDKESSNLDEHSLGFLPVSWTNINYEDRCNLRVTARKEIPFRESLSGLGGKWEK